MGSGVSDGCGKGWGRRREQVGVEWGRLAHWGGLTLGGRSCGSQRGRGAMRMAWKVTACDSVISHETEHLAWPGISSSCW